MTIIIFLFKLFLVVKLVFWILKHNWNIEVLQYAIRKNPACKVVGRLDAIIFIFSAASKNEVERELITKYHENLYNKFIVSCTMLSQTATAIFAILFLTTDDLDLLK